MFSEGGGVGWGRRNAKRKKIASSQHDFGSNDFCSNAFVFKDMLPSINGDASHTIKSLEIVSYFYKVKFGRFHFGQTYIRDLVKF